MAELSKKYEIVASSPKALALIDCPHMDNQGMRELDEDNAKYPFRSLLIGESFAVPFSDAHYGTLQSLRTSASHYGKKLSRKFRVFVHTEYNCVEVARIA